MVLAYCMTEIKPIPVPAHGVQNAEIKAFEAHGLRCYYSEGAEISAATSKQDALIFFSVVESVFRSATIIPFRFPTLLEGTAGIEAFLAAKASFYAGEIARLEGLAQMKISISVPPEAEEPAPESGTEYLKQKQHAIEKQEQATQAVMHVCSDLVKEWKKSFRKDTVFLLALAENKRCEEIKAKLHDREGLRVTGPWPPSEFVGPLSQ